VSAERFLYLSRADVEAVGLDMRSIIGLLERAFREKQPGAFASAVDYALDDMAVAPEVLKRATEAGL
jgi:ornithine cyclodeaminase/alanine dehydrogenase-like protein (mu-crystallin family)